MYPSTIINNVSEGEGNYFFSFLLFLSNSPILLTGQSRDMGQSTVCSVYTFINRCFCKWGFGR